MIYLDNNATTPIHPSVLEAMMPFLTEHWQNPSSGYRSARHVRQAIQTAREQVASLINASPEEIIFTSCGTESNNMVIKWLARVIGRTNGHALSSQIEHSSVLRPLEAMKKVGFQVSFLPVTSGGQLDLEAFSTACQLIQKQNQKGFLSLMWANNETGIIQPIQEATTLAKEHGLPVHSDAIQAFGKTPIDVQKTPLDFLSISGHKLHAPKGIGALYRKSTNTLEPLLRGGGQENGYRSGTENVAFIVALGHAASLMQQAYEQGEHKRVATLRNAFEEEIITGLQGHTKVLRNCDLQYPESRSFNISNLSFEDCDATGLLILLEQYGVLCSAGSACMTGKQEPSHVQTAMGYSNERARSSLRLSFSTLSTKNEATQAAQSIIKAIKKMKSVQGNNQVGPVHIYQPPSP